eukprot:COSAG06_NODE_3748_length_4947_cov_5.339109_3_plen_38_part_00
MAESPGGGNWQPLQLPQLTCRKFCKDLKVGNRYPNQD